MRTYNEKQIIIGSSTSILLSINSSNSFSYDQTGTLQKDVSKGMGYGIGHGCCGKVPEIL